MSHESGIRPPQVSLDFITNIHTGTEIGNNNPVTMKKVLVHHCLIRPLLHLLEDETSCLDISLGQGTK